MIERTPFDGHYWEWRKNRVEKIKSIYFLEHEDWFKGRDILELGCGYGDLGINFVELGANVLFAEVRKEHLEILRKKYNVSENNTVVLDQETKWNLSS